VEGSFPWRLVTRIGVYSQAIKTRAMAALSSASHNQRSTFCRIGTTKQDPR